MHGTAWLLALWVVAGQQAPAQIDVLIEESRAAAARRDDARADQAFREALVLLGRIPPGDPQEAKLNEAMGDAAVRRGDLELADQLYSRSLAALEGSARQTLDYARVSNALGAVAASRNQPSRARDLHDVAQKIHDSLAIKVEQKVSPLERAAQLTRLGLAREGAKAYDEALALHREALGIRENLSPQSAEVAESLERVATAMAMTGDALAAINAFGRAVDAWARVSPNSLDHANVIHELGLFLIRRGDEDEGLRRLREAVTVIESSFAKGFGERLQAYYQAPIRILAERGDAGEAFSLLDRLHERLRRARCTGCEDGPAPAAPVETSKRGIEGGTLVVAYSVQASATYVFVATREMPMRVYRIDESRAALSDRVQKFVERVRTPSAGAAYEAPLIADGRALFDLLLGPFERDATRAERLLIVPDGPLESLPFSALVRNRTGVAKWQYLIDWKPMAFAPSVASAAAWAGSASLGELFPTTAVPSGARMVGDPIHRGALVSLWPLAETTTDELAELFRLGLEQGRPRESALSRAQRVLRDERGRRHPSYWAAFRYYGPRGSQ